MIVFPPLPGITVGFDCPGFYSVAEAAGNASVTVELLSGTPARDVIVMLQTMDGTARGKDFQKVSTETKCVNMQN